MNLQQECKKKEQSASFLKKKWFFTYGSRAIGLVLNGRAVSQIKNFSSSLLMQSKFPLHLLQHRASNDLNLK